MTAQPLYKLLYSQVESLITLEQIDWDAGATGAGLKGRSEGAGAVGDWELRVGNNCRFGNSLTDGGASLSLKSVHDCNG